jgi:endonuclease YncB( thermonuclease family)
MTFKKPFRAPPIKPGKVYQLRVRKARRRETLRTIGYFVAASLIGVGVGIASFGLPGLSGAQDGGAVSFSAPALAAPMRTFSFCHTGGGINCVVDGDTIWMDGVKIRVADIDAPETHPPRCQYEADLGSRATRRLLELVNAGPITAEPSGYREEDRYGRKLRVLMRGGQSLGSILVSEGLARPWDGRRHPWC